MSRTADNRAGFYKSSFSPYTDDGGSGCVEICFDQEQVFVRHSDGMQGTIRFTREEWKAFIKGVKNAEFDL